MVELLTRFSLAPADIVRLVTEQEGQTTELRQRMEDDYQLYLLNEPEPEEGYQSYVTNEPQTFADMLISMMVLANLVVRFPIDSKGQEQRERDDDKERFITGVLRATDEHLADMLMPSLREQWAFFTALRGGYAARAVFARDENDKFSLDIMPWDRYNVFHGMGPKGLAWACHRIYRRPSDMREEFNAAASSNGHGESLSIPVYDYYDGEINCVVAQGEFVKQPTPHLAGRVPVILGAVGPAPPVIGLNAGSANPPSLYFGESVFKSNRAVYQSFNATMSDMRTLVRRSVKQAIVIESPGGKKTLDGDPYKEGAALSLAPGEKVFPLQLLEMAKESAALLGQVSGEMQRGSVPHTAFGELQFQLSGFAITQLRQGINARLQPCVTALERAYSQLIRLVIDQYKTGQFGDLELEGFDDRNQFFSQTFSSTDMQGKGKYPVVKLIPVLPEDEQVKYAMANMAREGDNPLLPNREILDKILQWQNVDSIQDQLNVQKAERLSPIAALQTLITSAFKLGRMDLVKVYYQDWLQLQAAAPQLGAPAGEPAPGAGPPGLAPQVLPDAMMGLPPRRPQPPGMPMRGPGQPRPGALSEQGRLARIGMVPGR